MTVIATMWRQVAVLDWDEDLVHGDMITVHAKNPDTGEELEPKKTVPNDPDDPPHLAFPFDYDGTCYVEIRGSDGGTDEGLLKIGLEGEWPEDEGVPPPHSE